MAKKDRFYLNCPYNEKDDCKNRGAYWDADIRKWYVPEGLNIDDFKQWWPDENHNVIEQVTAIAPDRFYLNVPFEAKDDAKAKGARWDPELKRWHVPNNLDRNDFINWWPLTEDK